MGLLIYSTLWTFIDAFWGRKKSPMGSFHHVDADIVFTLALKTKNNIYTVHTGNLKHKFLWFKVILYNSFFPKNKSIVLSDFFFNLLLSCCSAILHLFCIPPLSSLLCCYPFPRRMLHKEHILPAAVRKSSAVFKQRSPQRITAIHPILAFVGAKIFCTPNSQQICIFLCGPLAKAKSRTFWSPPLPAIPYEVERSHTSCDLCNHI